MLHTRRVFTVLSSYPSESYSNLKEFYAVQTYGVHCTLLPYPPESYSDPEKMHPPLLTTVPNFGSNLLNVPIF